jgi:hypothetical protein
MEPPAAWLHAMIKASKRKDLLVLFLVLISCLGNLHSAGAESLPETVKRHEEEIKALKNAVDFIKREQQTKTDTESKKKEPVVCRKDFAVVGRQTQTPSALITGVTLSGTDIYLKLIRNGKDEGGYWTSLASNVDELNNKKLYEGGEYKFTYRNCALIMTIEDVSMVSAGLRFVLNYP